MSRSSPTLLPSVRDQLLNDLIEELRALDDDGLLRRLTTLEAIDGPLVRIGGREVVNWCSNDYLGLSQHPALIEAAASAATQWGIGARASRLLAGTTIWHTRLEEVLAAWYATEAAIVYPSGYLANLGTLSALLSPDDAVFVDRFAHASLLDAARATRATFRVFAHHDLTQLADALTRAPRARRRLIVTEGVFSMDGDSPNLAALLELADAHHALVYLDDAHGAFVTGATGRGTPEAAGIAHERLLYMGALGKALGCQGGFVIGPRALIDSLRNRARTFIYTTALAVPVAAAAVEALRVLGTTPDLRRRLDQRVMQLHEALVHAGVTRSTARSHIVPIVVGASDRTVMLARALFEQGLWAPAIRPPTVPEGSARLRVSVTALHTEGQVDALAQAVCQGLARLPRAT